MKYLLMAIFFRLTFTTIGQVPNAARILLIPLDDRPPCLQFPIKMGLIGDVTVVTPPRPMLGRFTQAGQCDSIILWLKKQDLTRFDAAIISIDMLAYGGLVASRVHDTPVETALSRLGIIKTIRQIAPSVKIYGSSVIMRLAPTGTGANEAYREKLARWADYAPYPEHKDIVLELEKDIPAEALTDYKKARQRNLTVNLTAIDLVKSGVLDYLILSQDDAKPKGIHISDRETLIGQVNNAQLQPKITVQPGADEVSMLLLARAMSDKYAYHPKVKAVYSTEAVAHQIMPFEDRPLSKTVSFHLLSVGAEEVSDIAQADIVYFVFASRFDEGVAARFANEIINFNKKNPKKGIIIADVDPKGDVQGGDTTFTEILKQGGIFSNIFGYACWNTAGNTIGTALPHGILYGVSKILPSQRNRIARTRRAQMWFTLNRLLDDYAYHSIVRPQALKRIKANQWNSLRLTDAQTAQIESFCYKKLLPIAQKTVKNALSTEGGYQLARLRFSLPWNRTFEAEIDAVIRKVNK